MPIDARTIISEHILEMRYRPFGRLLDIRGLIADWIADHAGLSSWSITENRVDFKINEDSDRERAFVSHRNLGYVVRSPDTRNYVPDRATRFVRELLRVDGFQLRPVLRFGYRSRFLLPYTDGFEDLVKLVNARMPLPESLTKPFDARIEDVGSVVVLRKGKTRIKVQSGPMEQEQAKGVLQGHEHLPVVGFFIDMDQYQIDVGEMVEKDVTELLRSLNDSAWAAVDYYNGLLL